MVSPINSPVLFIVFNRPDHTSMVLEAIRKASPSKLYVSCDGPRRNNHSDFHLVDKVRSLFDSLDWDCKLYTNFSHTNKGCKLAVSDAINWFFDNEDEGIILEDDCLPNPSFFSFCDNLLEFYRSDDRVAMISGNNFQRGMLRGSYSYYFSRIPHIWGWATWKRSWSYYQLSISFWPSWKTSDCWIKTFPNNSERRYWQSIFDAVYDGRIDTWDYSWVASMLYNDLLSVMPNSNLVQNIGFDASATHTKSSPLFSTTAFEISTLNHPPSVVWDSDADASDYVYIFNGRYRKFPLSLLSYAQSFKNNLFFLLYSLWKKFRLRICKP